MPSMNWGEVMDALRGLDSKIATPIKTAIAMLEELNAAEAALWTARRGLEGIEAQTRAAVTAHAAAVESATFAHADAEAEVARCRKATAEAQAAEQAAMKQASAAADRMERQAEVRSKELADAYTSQAAAIQVEFGALTATRDALAAEIADLRRRVGAL